MHKKFFGFLGILFVLFYSNFIDNRPICYLLLIIHFNKLYISFNYNDNMSIEENEVLVKITSAGTISIPKQFRKYMDVQKGEYVKMTLGNDRLIVRKITIS